MTKEEAATVVSLGVARDEGVRGRKQTTSRERDKKWKKE